MKAAYALLMCGTRTWRHLRRTEFSCRSGYLVRFFALHDEIRRITYLNPYYSHWRFSDHAKQFVLNLCTSRLGDPLAGEFSSRSAPKTRILNPLNLRRYISGTEWPWGLVRRRVRKSLDRRLALIVWLYNPAENGIFDRFPEAIKVFETDDNWIELARDDPRRVRANPWFNFQRTQDGYSSIAANDQVLIVANGREMSSFLADLGASRERILEIPNAVDPALFCPEDVRASGLPPDLEQIPRPRIGYVGLPEGRIDVDLLGFLAAGNPTWSFVFVGPVGGSDHLPDMPNIHRLGYRRHSAIPRYVLGFDVCMIPHRCNPATRYQSPLKVYQYLAMGKPVVATPVGGLEGLQGLCRVAEGHEAFQLALRQAMRNGADRAVSDHVRSRHSWENRVGTILRWIGDRSAGDHLAGGSRSG